MLVLKSILDQHLCTKMLTCESVSDLYADFDIRFIFNSYRDRKSHKIKRISDAGSDRFDRS